MRSALLLLVLLLSSQANPAEPAVILVLGDSLSSAYGIPPDRGWVSLLRQRLESQGPAYVVVNASITGDTTRGGLARLPRLLATHRPRVVLIERCGDDGLLGFQPAQIRKHLAEMVELARSAGAEVMLLGVKLPPNYGPAYVNIFHRVYFEVADAAEVPLIPFILEGVAEDRALMLDDGIHPNAEAQERILDNIWPQLETLLRPENPGLAQPVPSAAAAAG